MEQNVNEDNKIAEFLGSKYVNDPYFDKEINETVDFWHWTKPECGYLRTVGGIELSTRWQMGIFDFRTSWDALMPVVEKIEQLLFAVEIKENGCVITGYRKYAGKMFVRKETLKTKLQVTFEAVIDFITWYNSQK